MISTSLFWLAGYVCYAAHNTNNDTVTVVLNKVFFDKELAKHAVSTVGNVLQAGSCEIYNNGSAFHDRYACRVVNVPMTCIEELYNNAK